MSKVKVREPYKIGDTFLRIGSGDVHISGTFLSPTYLLLVPGSRVQIETPESVHSSR